MSVNLSTNRSKRIFSTRMMASIAILSAISAILMRIEFPLPIAPPFYKIDVSEVAVLIGGFAFGPWAAIMIEAMKNIIYVIFGGTSSAYVGELANFVMGCALVLPPVLLYQHAKSRTHAIMGLVLGVVSLSVVGALINYYVMLPAFAVLYHLPIEEMISAGQAINPDIHDLFTFVLLATTPFNIIKGFLVSVIVFISYKKISIIIKGAR